MDLKRIEKLRPKGFLKKVWVYYFEEALKNKEWALNTVKVNPEWANKASEYSIEMLGEYLYKDPQVLAKESYEYFHMRAYIVQCRSAVTNWENLTGRKIRKFL